MSETSMTIINEEGREIEVEILLTFDDEASGTQYVLFVNPENDEDVYAYRYTDDGELIEIETEEEWNMCEEVLNAFQDEDIGDA